MAREFDHADIRYTDMTQDPDSGFDTYVRRPGAAEDHLEYVPGVAALGVNDVIITENLGNMVVRAQLDGSESREFGIISEQAIQKGARRASMSLNLSLKRPFGVAVDMVDGSVFISSKNRVDRFRADGDWDYTTGTDSKGQLKEPRGLCVDERRLYVADLGKSRIAVFTKEQGEYQLDIGGELLMRPLGVVVHQGKLYVSDEGLNKLVVFSLDELARPPRTHDLGDKLTKIAGLAVDPDTGCLAVCDQRDQRVVFVRVEGDACAVVDQVTCGLREVSEVPLAVTFTPDKLMVVTLHCTDGSVFQSRVVVFRGPTRAE